MYLNFNLIDKKGLSVVSVLLLQAVKQQKFENNETVIMNLEVLMNGTISTLTSLNYIKSIKGNKRDSELSKLRITSMGQDFLDNIETPEINDDDVLLFDWVKKLYLDRGKEVGNAKKAKQYISQFRVHSGIDKNKLAILLREFLLDDDAQNFSMRVDYIFWKPSNVFQTRFELENSRLWKYYEKRKNFFIGKFQTV